MRDEPLAARLAAIQAACSHRFDLVGYRRRPGDSTSQNDAERAKREACLMDAVLVCCRCTMEHLAGVTYVKPSIETKPVSDPLAGSPADLAYWSGQSPRKFEPLEALDRITDAVESLGFGPRHSVGIAVFRAVRALRAYITGIERREQLDTDLLLANAKTLQKELRSLGNLASDATDHRVVIADWRFVELLAAAKRLVEALS